MSALLLFLAVFVAWIALVCVVAERLRAYLDRKYGGDGADFYVGMREAAGFPDMRDSYSPDGDDL